MTAPNVLRIGDAVLRPVIQSEQFHSLGAVSIAGVAVRNTVSRFLPWFDTHEDDAFRRFRFVDLVEDGTRTRIKLRAVSDPDTMFRQRRDSSGDPVYRRSSWDNPPVEVDLDIVLEPARATIDGRAFTGFKYWFEFDGSAAGVGIHRLLDRQTWELGGNLNDVTLLLRNWLTPPRMRIAREMTYSTAGLDQWASLLPGNMWGRWTLMPSFDMQYGESGVLLGRFDRMSLIRTVVEKSSGDDELRFLDMHYFEMSQQIATNPKTILFSPDRLDNIDALNLWTRVQDAEHERATQQIGIKNDHPPAVVFWENVWHNARLASTYEEGLERAEELGGEIFLIDPVWESQEALRQDVHRIAGEQLDGSALAKFWHQNHCVVLDWEIAKTHGGEEELKKLVDRAAKRGLKIISWMASHMSPNSAVSLNRELGAGAGGIFACRESGRHPDTGYPASCWPINLNAPIGEWVKQKILGVCQRTGLAGFLWDSFCNLGWWQIDYSQGTMRPQNDKQAEMFRDLVNAGLYIMPEAIVTFANASCCGLHGGNVYADDLLAFSYNTQIALTYPEHGDADDSIPELVLRGKLPIDTLFRCYAHKRIPQFRAHRVPRSEWHEPAAAAIRGLNLSYRTIRSRMVRRTVMKDDLGVLWDSPIDSCQGETRGTRILFAFRTQQLDAPAVDVRSNSPVIDGRVQPGRIYRIKSRDASLD